MSHAELTLAIIDNDVGSRVVGRCGKFGHFMYWCSVIDTRTGIVPCQIPYLARISLFFQQLVDVKLLIELFEIELRLGFIFFVSFEVVFFVVRGIICIIVFVVGIISLVLIVFFVIVVMFR